MVALSSSLMTLLLAATLLPQSCHGVDFFAPDWIIPADGQPYPSMTASVGDTLTFSWSQGTHDVWIHPTHTCDETGAIQIASTADNPTTYTFQPADGSPSGITHTFVCDVGSHCEVGMYMNVTVFSLQATDTGNGNGNGGDTATPATAPPTDADTTDAPATDAPTEATTEQATYDTCYVCGNEIDTIIRTNLTVQFPTESGDVFEVTCQQVYDDGLAGRIPETACEFIAGATQANCGCALPNYTCNICDPDGSSSGQNLVVKSPDAVPEIPGQPPRTCAELDEAGKGRLIPPGECSALAIFTAQTCGCAPADFTCSVCGDGWQVSNAGSLINEDLLSFLEEDEVLTCAELQEQGLAGNLTPAECNEAEFSIRTTCGCTPEGGFAQCSICGQGSETLAPEAEISITGLPATTCGDLQAQGLNGTLNPSQCVASQVAAAVSCSCAPEGYTCSICGEGRVSLSPEKNISVSGVESVNCGVLEMSGLDGRLTPADCAVVQPIANVACDCAPEGFTCSICGDGYIATSRNETFLPGEPLTCGEADDDGKAGRLTPSVCSSYTPLALISCGCELDTDSPPPATAAPSTTDTTETTPPADTNMTGGPNEATDSPGDFTPAPSSSIEYSGGEQPDAAAAAADFRLTLWRVLTVNVASMVIVMGWAAQ